MQSINAVYSIADESLAHAREGTIRAHNAVRLDFALLGLSSDFVAHGCCFHIDASPAYNARPVVHTCAQASGLTEAEQLCTRPVDGMHAMPERVGVQENELTRCQCVLALCACRARAVGLLIPQVQRASTQWQGDEIKTLVLYTGAPRPAAARIQRDARGFAAAHFHFAPAGCLRPTAQNRAAFTARARAVVAVIERDARTVRDIRFRVALEHIYLVTCLGEKARCKSTAGTTADDYEA